MAAYGKRVMRLDSQPLNQTYFTEEGYLKDRPILTSTGIFEYQEPDGSIRRELRTPEEVFDPESLASYRAKPIIVTHDAGLITKENVGEEQIGTIMSKGYRSGDDVRAEIIIHDTDRIKESGFRELSLGYNLDLDETPGVWEGEPYDAIQRNIRINHLALVREARAGDQARLNIDSRESTILEGGKVEMAKKTVAKKATKHQTKKTVRKDGILSPDELKVAIEEYKRSRENEVAEDDDEVVIEIPEITAENAEEQVELVKDRRDRRDEEDDPETLDDAEEVIARQDEDISILFDIIDTLLAQIAFDENDEGCNLDDEEVLVEDEDEDLNEDEDEDLNEDDDEDLVDDEEVLVEDDDEEVLVEDDDEEILAEDDDEEVIIEYEDDEDIPIATVNADSIDKIVRERVQIAKTASLLNMDGLENVKPIKAKRTIIRAVKPGIRLDGKSRAYVDAMFDLCCNEVQKKSRKSSDYQLKQMFNGDSKQARRRVNSTQAAREKMIKRMQNKR